MPEGALSAYRVLDLTHYTAGPYCTRLLSGLGADVIKIENPCGGDGARRLGPFVRDNPNPEKSKPFLHLNTGKKSFTLDLKSPAGTRAFKELVRQADIVVENFEPRVMPALGLDFDTLARVNPRLVMTSISNFGQTGPYRDYKATELTEYAMSGLMYITGERDREPLKLGLEIAQFVAGQYALMGTLSALYSREMTGEGQHVDVSLMECNAGLLEIQVMQYFYVGHVPTRIGNANEKGHPWGIFPCRDGWVTITPQPRRWPDMVRLMGIPELLDDRFATRFKRIQLRDEVDALMLPWLLEHDKQDIYDAFTAKGLAAGWVRNVKEILTCPQLASRDYFAEIEHPVAGKALYPSAPFKMAETPWHMGRAPLLGEHSEESLCSRLGCSKDDAARLKEESVNRVLDRQAGRTPLEGVRVLGVVHQWAGPHCCQLLADLGAEVIKVETPEGDMVRGVRIPAPGSGTYPAGLAGSKPYNRSGPFNQISHGQLSIGLDMTQPKGAELFKEMVRISDVVIHNYRAGTLDRMGLGYLALRDVNPRIIMMSMTGYGETGPLKSHAIFGVAMEPSCGFSALTGYIDDETPLRSGVDHVDPLTGNLGAGAVLAALLYRKNTGKGQYIDLSFLECAVSLLGQQVLDFSMDGRMQGHIGNRHRSMAPHGCYRCQGDDRWVTIAVASDEEWKGLCRALGDPDWTRDARFADASSRWRSQDELDRLIEQWTIERDSHDVMHLLQRANVAAGAVLSVADLAKDPHLQARGFFEPVPHPEAGTYAYMGSRVKYSRTPLRIQRPAPCYAEHNDYVFGKLLGLNPDEIAGLAREKAIYYEPVMTESFG